MPLAMEHGFSRSYPTNVRLTSLISSLRRLLDVKHPFMRIVHTFTKILLIPCIESMYILNPISLISVNVSRSPSFSVPYNSRFHLFEDEFLNQVIRCHIIQNLHLMSRPREFCSNLLMQRISRGSKEYQPLMSLPGR